jgi:hypothetical protein
MLRLLLVPAFGDAIEDGNGAFDLVERPVEDREVVIGER